MSKSVFRIAQTALSECTNAIHSRRAIVILALYLVSSVFCMTGTISILGKMETELANVLQIPESDRTGIISATLWRSRPFQRMVRNAVRNDLVYDDIKGRHPAELIYAWFAFMFAPLLAVLTAGNRIADELRSGSVRYSIVRVTRLEWTLGKYFGQVMMVSFALAASAAGAWCVAAFRLSGIGTASLLASMFEWGARAGIYALAWLGLAMGISHATRSGHRATAMGILSIALMAALPFLLRVWGSWLDCAWLQNFDILAPASSEHYLWRRGPAPLLAGGMQLATLGMFYLMLGHAVFRRRDA